MVWPFDRKNAPEEEAPSPKIESISTPPPAIKPSPVKFTNLQPRKMEISAMPELPNPGKYEDLNKESKTIIGTTEVFDGFRFDFNKGIYDGFGVNHTMSLGSVMEPASYNFGTNYALGGILLWGRVDTEGHLIGRYQHQVSKNFTYRLGGQATNEPHNSNVHAEVDYQGDDYFAQAKWANPGTYGISYMQSLTPKWSAGCEAYYNHSQALTMVTAGTRYATPKSVTAAVAAWGLLSVSYTQLVSEKVSISSELVFQQSQHGFESLWALGYEYRLRMSNFRGHIDSAGKVAGYLEEGLNQYTKFILCGELDHSKRRYRFGIGMQMAL